MATLLETSPRNGGLCSRGMRLAALTLIACALAPWMGRASRAGEAPAASTHIEWPMQWQGRTLRPLALTAIESRFATGFPGTIARFGDDEGRVLVMRHVTQPTRMLHPAADCFRGAGYSVHNVRLEIRDGEQGAPWRCFEARPSSAGIAAGPMRVCERIVGSDGSTFADTSSWFWAAALQHSVGPWRAITLVEAP